MQPQLVRLSVAKQPSTAPTRRHGIHQPNTLACDRCSGHGDKSRSSVMGVGVMHSSQVKCSCKMRGKPCTSAPLPPLGSFCSGRGKLSALGTWVCADTLAPSVLSCHNSTFTSAQPACSTSCQKSTHMYLQVVVCPAPAPSLQGLLTPAMSTVMQGCTLKQAACSRTRAASACAILLQSSMWPVSVDQPLCRGRLAMCAVQGARDQGILRAIDSSLAIRVSLPTCVCCVPTGSRRNSQTYSRAGLHTRRVTS
jgi:hypothetical protein